MGRQGSASENRLSCRDKKQKSNVYVPLPAVIETRKNLAKAEAVLGCLAIALMYEADEQVGQPYYADAVDAARDLIRLCKHELDSAKLVSSMAE